jgi:hypothetical protein
MFRFRKVLTAVGMTACLLGTTASADASQAGGQIRVFATYLTPTKDKVLITGAIGDYGTEITQNANGKPDSEGNFEKVILKHGGFTINATALNNKLAKVPPVKPNHTNCSLEFVGTGFVTVGNGTDAYAGIAGKIKVTVTYAGIEQKTSKGCNASHNAPFYGQYQSITGVGNVRFVTS